jgi:hypothetical protein
MAPVSGEKLRESSRRRNALFRARQKQNKEDLANALIALEACVLFLQSPAGAETLRRDALEKARSVLEPHGRWQPPGHGAQNSLVNEPTVILPEEDFLEWP